MTDFNSKISFTSNFTKPFIEKKNKSSLEIFYYNDTHGNSDQISGLVHSAKSFKNKNSNCDKFVLSAGDNVSGADIKKNEFIYALMQNIMGVDASAIGNHEIDACSKGFIDSIKNKNIPFIATNVEYLNNNPMENVVKKSIIKEQNGNKYGFIGAMPIDFEDCTKEDVQTDIKIMNFDNTIKALQKEIDNLKAQGVNKIILLSHTGYEEDKKIAKNLDGVDIIVGGHTHSVVDGIEKEKNLVMSKTNQPVLITQAGENGKLYGIANIEFDSNGIIQKAKNTLHKSTNTSKSPLIEYIKENIMGKSPFVAKIKEIDSMPKNRRIENCAWTCKMADSIKNELGTDLAFINAANIRKVPQAGNITQRDIQESAPMKNDLVKTKMNQKEVVEAIENAAKRTLTSKDGTPGLIIPAGLTYKVDEKGNLLSLSIVDKNDKENPVDIKNPSEEISYTVAYDSFVGQEGGEYPEIVPKDKHKKYDYDKDKTMINYLSKLNKGNDNIVITDDKRVQIQKTSPKTMINSSMQSFLDLTCPKVS